MTTDYTQAFRLDGKVALVTGGARGLGGEVARAMASVGAKVLVTDVLEKEGLATAEALQAEGFTADFRAQDTTSEDQWKSTIAGLIEQYGGFDVLVNNAGIERQSLVTDTTIEEYKELQEINSVGVFLGIKHAVVAMRPGGAAGNGGSIINLSSIAGLIGIPALGGYSASKGAVRLLTKSAAVECAQLRTGVRINSIHPGLIKTSMGDRFISKFVDLGLAPNLEASEAAFMAAVPMGDWGAPSDIAAGAVFLASDASKFVTGAELVIDGGFTAV